MRHHWLSFAIAVASFVLGAWSYLVARTMQETVGFDLAVTLRALLLPAIIGVLGLALGRLALALSGDSRWTPMRRLCASWLIPLVVASLPAELWILRDEARFRAEVAAAPDVRFARARIWPMGTTALVYRPEYGITATD